MSTNSRKPIYTDQRTLMTELANTLLQTGPEHLDSGFTGDWNEALTDSARKRVIVDQVASLTDQSAISWHARLVRGAVQP
jgi:dGTPase